MCDQGIEDQVEPSETYFQMSYRLLEAVMSRCDADGSISDAKKAEDDVQLLVREVNSFENPEAIRLQAIGYGSSVGALIVNRTLLSYRWQVFGLGSIDY